MSEPTDLAKSANARDGDIQAVTRCAQILRLFAVHDSVRASLVADALGLQRSTAHRYLITMEKADLLERRSEGDFVEGPLTIQMGAGALRRSRVVEVAASYMASLSADSHATVALSLWGGHGAVVARVAEDMTQTVHVTIREGTLLPLVAAQSQVFLTFMSDQQRARALIDAEPANIREELVAGRARTLATGFGSRSDVVQGIHAVASPIFNVHGNVCATIALVGTTDSLLAGPTSNLWRALGSTADQVSVQLGFSGGIAAVIGETTT
jgi:DNA-binding IclR family transcriptional regulator